MPQLVRGHVRFTDDDFLYSDLHHKITEYTMQEKQITIEQNISILHEEIEYFTEKYVLSENTSSSVKNREGIVLSGILDILLVLSRKYGYSLEDLIRIQKQ
jgi:hypothetical protein